MKRVYFSINEQAARRAKEMMSFSDYKEGSKTEEYRKMCDITYEIAEKVIAERPSEEERVTMLAERYAKRLADNINRDINIGCRCPSFLVSGGSNFPVRKKEKQVAAWEKNNEDYKEIQKIRDKIVSISRGKDIIKSNDENAIERLEEKLEKLELLQEKMKETNKAIRMKDAEKGNQKSHEMGYSDIDILKLREPDFCGRVGFPDYALKNNNANIKSTKARIEQLKKTKAEGDTATECEFFTIKENSEEMRIQLYFEDKPEADIRDILKHNGFKWSPKNVCWQRQLNNNGRYAVKSVVKALNEKATCDSN